MSRTRTFLVNILSWKKEKPCSPRARKLLSSQHRGVVHSGGYNRIPTSLTLELWWFSGQNVRSSIRRVASSILARGTKIFVAPGEHGSSFFQVKMFTGSVRVLLTSASLKLKSNYLELGYTSCWQMIKETLANYILSHVQIPPVQTNKQLMVEAEYDNNTNNTIKNN